MALPFQAAGVPAYWLVDPDEPSLTVLALREGRYVDDAVVRGDEAYVAGPPCNVRVVPNELRRGL